MTRAKGENLVARTSSTLRERIFAAPAGACIGSLHALARDLGVGIVTLQQAARVLEHEGLLEVRRGPGGGYYGARPDDAALERSLYAFMRLHPASYAEALDMTSLLFTELATAAASCTDAGLRARLGGVDQRFAVCRTSAEFGVLEVDFQELLFQMVRRPLFEMLTRVTLHAASSRAATPAVAQDRRVEAWCEGRRRIIAAILANDPALARFEADRRNRAVVLARLKDGQARESAPGGAMQPVSSGISQIGAD